MYTGSSSSSSKKKKMWREEKERLLSMSQAERRKELCKDYIPLDSVPSLLKELKTPCDDEHQEISVLCEKVSLYKGDITQLEVDAIVNAANSSLLGGGGVDGCIHRASGPLLSAECRTLGGCPTGQAKITCGYELPAKYVIHTVGPIARGQLSDSHKEDLANCYKSSLALVKEKSIRSIAFPCISTGIYGFPNEPAAIIALTTAKEWLKKNREEIDRIIFCVFLEVDYKIYKKKLTEFFLKDGDDDTEDDKKEERNQVSKKISEDLKGTDKNAQSPPTKKCKAKKTDMQEKPDDAAEDQKEPSQDAENVGDRKEAATDSNTQEMKETIQDSDDESCAQADSAEKSKAEISDYNEKSGQNESPLHTNADVDMAEASQDQEVSMDKENRNADEMNIEPQVQSRDITKTLSSSLEDEPNEPNHETQGTIPIADPCSQAESEEVSEDVHMLSQNLDRPCDDEEADTAALEK
ncbi:ADP-ribose glycohydrolase MACROD2 [Hyla sarda]|uniref:ADP-ribose glycohydrolase MACROD2 n=1 Tax=Hyla sarda TaxID=327740 RepID=UPI0024C31958|nr:ADP-ribose glycohydrolase MACROD2 [Hyla sarda]